MSYHTGLQVLRAKVRGFNVAGVTLAKRINKASGDKRQKLRLEKKRLGAYSRVHLVAYGLLRGVKYSAIEQRGCYSNRLDVSAVLAVIHQHADHDQLKEFTLEKVKSLLDRSVPRCVEDVDEFPTPSISMRVVAAIKRFAGGK